MNAPATMSEMKSSLANIQDTKVDMFSARGFALAQRIANAFASSDAVPAQFRQYNLKKTKEGEQWVENPAAIGNCIVAIEVAQAVGMSVTAVMQNADVIEGKLRWSGKFVIAAINASRRFTPLRFDVKNLGHITASYKEKGSWNNDARRYNMVDKSVDVENLQCIAWALPHGYALPKGIYTLDQARVAGLPVIESAPVSMKLAVEEGWYAKAGSKWQTELKHMMLQYRAGTFFGNIHAPDIVMGMGRTAEEEREIIDLNPDGSYTMGTESVDLNALRTKAAPADVVQAEPEPPRSPSSDATEEQRPTASEDAGAPRPTFDQVKRDLLTAETPEDLDYARSFIKGFDEEQAKASLNAIASRRMRELAPPDEPPAQPQRRARAPINAD